MSSKDLLIEIGTEELPPKALKTLGMAFMSGIEAGLNGAELPFESLQYFATPRRLAVIVTDLQARQPDREIEKFGPAIKAAFDAAGNPSPAARGFAGSCGVNVDSLERADKDGVEKLVYRSTEQGKDTTELLQDIAQQALQKLPVPKRMHWGSSRIEFVRPVHWVVLLFGESPVEATILGKQASRDSYGHRFHHPQKITLRDPAEYASVLSEQAYVIADFEIRKEKIRSLVQEQADAIAANIVMNEALLEEVTSLVEWPVALTGTFDTHFLTVPAEALVSSLQSHQKCFCLKDNDGNLLPHFIFVSNIESTDPKQVIEGNERVIRPRLADADFFYRTDLKSTLENQLPRLEKIVFQQDLGTVYDKSVRVGRLASVIAELAGTDASLCERAALLSKCDLVTNMVGEFADLQGIMGKYYALNDGEEPEVAAALFEQYLPRFAGDILPESQTGKVLSLADKLDTICGLFVIGQPPTGSKDPFALRRAAIGVLRILVERKLDLDLAYCISSALANFSDVKSQSDVDGRILEFFLERFRFWYQDEGVAPEVLQSVMALKPTNPLDFNARVHAVSHFSKLPEAAALSSANKRVANILSKSSDLVPDGTIDESLLADPEEILLAREIKSKEIDVAPLFEAREYRAGLEKLAEMKKPIDSFFDKVLVNSDDDALRINRLALLSRLRSLFLQVADISFLYKA